jgi:hypothetical protein
VLDDGTRDLWSGVGLVGGPWRDRVLGEQPVAAKLDRALTSLERWLHNQPGRRNGKGRLPAGTPAQVSRGTRVVSGRHRRAGRDDRRQR